MYTIFLIKTKATDTETGENVYICGPDGYEHILSPANVTHYCSTADGDLIRYETYNEHVAAALMLDAGFVADREDSVPAGWLAASKTYTWEGPEGEQVSGSIVDWDAADKPEIIASTGPAQIFGPGTATYMTIEQAQAIVDALPAEEV